MDYVAHVQMVCCAAQKLKLIYRVDEKLDTKEPMSAQTKNAATAALFETLLGPIGEA